MKYQNILETIGRTPHVRLTKLFPEANNKKIEIWIKLEKQNPGGSIKDRIAFSMIEDAEKKGILKKDTLIIEPTSGNTGVGLALISAVKGYKMILVMPESMTIERRKLMAAYGATLELTPREKGMKGAIERAHELMKQNPNSWMPMQFDNKANPEIHAQTTAMEIVEDFPQGFDYMIAGVGTGGHFSGCGKILKEKFPKIKVMAVEPEESAVISGRSPGPHPIQGIGAGFIPNNFNQKLCDGVLTVNKDQAYDYAQKMAKEEGIMVGVSTGAVLAALAKQISEMEEGTKVLTFCYDTGERYLSVPGLY